MGYSDIEDERVGAFLQHEQGLFYNTEEDFLYAKNSITYLENGISQSTEQNKDSDLNKVIPYMHDYYPVFTFANDQSFSLLPEFYEDYPVLVSNEEYNDGLRDQYHTVYKIWEGDSQEVRIVPKNSVHRLCADIISTEAYLVSYKYVEGTGKDEGTHYIKDSKSVAFLDSDDYTFDSTTGKLVLNEDTYNDLKDDISDEQEEEGSEFEVFIIFEIHIEKYRSIDDLGNLTEVEMEQIATMQSIQAAILEYYYQFQIAIETQQKLDEIAYTVVITVISTLLTAGIGAAAGLKGLSFWSVTSEPFEEVFIDPFIEDAASGFARSMGGDRYAEVVASTLATTFRETRFGIFGASTDQNVAQDKHASGEIDPTGRDTLQQVAEKDSQTREQAESSKVSKVAKAAITFLAVLSIPVAGAGATALLGMYASTALSAYWVNKVPVKQALGALIGRYKTSQIVVHGLGEVGVDALSFMTAQLAIGLAVEEVYDTKRNDFDKLMEYNYEDDSYAVPNSGKPIATVEMVQKIAALISLQGENLFRTEEGLYRTDAYLEALKYLTQLGYDISEVIRFTGGKNPKRARSDPSYRLSEEDRKIVAEEFATFLTETARILNVYKKDLPSIFGYKSSSTFRTCIQNLKRGKFLAHSLYKALESRYELVLEYIENRELGEQVRRQFLELYETHKIELIKHTKTVIRQQFKHYESQFARKGWTIVTPFEQFADAVLKQGVDPSQFIAEVWCGVEGHSTKRVRISSASTMGEDYKCLDCEQWSGSITYDDLFLATDTLDLEILRIRSQKDWLKLVVKNHKNGIPPSRIEIKVKCANDHEFYTNYDKIKQVIRYGRGNGCQKCQADAIRIGARTGTDLEKKKVFITRLQQLKEKFSANLDKVKKACEQGYVSRKFLFTIEEALHNEGEFSFSVDDYAKRHPKEYQRCSNFYRQINTGNKETLRTLKRNRIKELIEAGKILNIDSKTVVSSAIAPIKDLIKIVNEYEGDKWKKNWPAHEGIADDCEIKLAEYFVVAELPIYRKSGEKLVTGHPDIVLIIGDTLFLCDYKPDGSPDPNTSELAKSFLDSIPQVAS